MTSWRISGDAGDAVFQLSLMHFLGGKHIIRCVDRPGVTSPWTPRVPLIKELFEAQPYVEAVEISEEDVDIDLVLFRRWHSSVTPLVSANCAEYQMQVGRYLKVDGSMPWLTVEPDKSFNGKIIISRSPRYNNPRFPWKKIVQHYGHRLIFVGLEVEHKTFCESFGEVLHLRTKNLMEVAKAISGAQFFIGNQSSPNAISLGLGKDMATECDSAQPDCVYPRTNAQFVCDGSMVLPDISGSGELKIPPFIDIPTSFNKSLVPPLFWQYDSLPPNPHFSLQVELVKQKEGVSTEVAEEMLFEANARRVPDFFLGTNSGNSPMDLFNQACRNANLRQEQISVKNNN